MNQYINSVQLMGHIGRDPEVFQLTSGRTLVKFSMATNESYKDKDGSWQQSTQWHRITAWGKTAEKAASDLTKGSHILLRGKLNNSDWVDKEGQKRYSTDIIMSSYLRIARETQPASGELAAPQ